MLNDAANVNSLTCGGIVIDDAAKAALASNRLSGPNEVTFQHGKGTADSGTDQINSGKMQVKV